MTPTIPGFGVALLRRAMDFANRAYEGAASFSEFKIIAQYKENSLFHPAYFVFESDSSLYVVVRGSHSTEDWQTNFEYKEKTVNFGEDSMKVHGGFYESAKNIYSEIKDKIKKYKGNIYITGHSLGGCVSIPLGLMIMTEKETKELKSYVIAFAPAPVVEFIPRALLKRIVTVANDKDIVCRLSIPCCHNLIRALIPKSGVPKALLKSALKLTLKHMQEHKETFGDTLYHAAMNSINKIVEDLANYHNDRGYVHVKYLTGLIYKLDDQHSKLETCISSPAKFNSLTVSSKSVNDHYQSAYISMLEHLYD